MNISEFQLSKHAIDRALDMGVTGAQLRECLLHPEHVYKSHKYAGRKNYVHGDVGCAVSPDMTVVTVQWANTEAWKADLSIGTYGGREVRETDRVTPCPV